MRRSKVKHTDKLRARLGAIATEMKALNEKMSAEGYQENADDTAAWDKLKGESATVKGQLDRALDVERLEAEANTVVLAAARGQTTVPGPQPATQFENFGEFMHAVRFRPNDQRLASSWHEWEPKGEQRMDTGSLGGFAVPTQFRSDLMRIEAQGALVRPRATVIPAGSPPDSAITMPALDQTGTNPANVYGGVSVNKVAEGGAKPNTGFKLREIKLEPQEIAGSLETTDKLLRNWSAASSVIENLFRGAMAAFEDTEFLRGNGVGGPLGVINSGAVFSINRAVAAQFAYADVSAMLARFLLDGAISPVWSISQSVMPQLLTMRNPTTGGGDGSLIWQPNARDNAGNQLLMGYPIFWNQRNPALGTKGDVGLYDFSKYLIKDGSGPFVAASEHVKFLENKTVFKIFWNVDGQPWLTAPFTQEGGYQVSPFVVLDIPT
jgi:HK97 family phage major capsid protein